MLSASAARRNGKGRKPDFKVSAKVCDNINFEIIFGLFKSAAKANTVSAKVDIVDLAIMMKDSLNFIYCQKQIEIDVSTFGVHVFGMQPFYYALLPFIIHLLISLNKCRICTPYLCHGSVI